MTRAARVPEIACDSRKQKLYRLNRPLCINTIQPELCVRGNGMGNSVLVEFKNINSLKDIQLNM